MAKSAQTVEQMFLRLLLFFLSSSFSSALVTLGSTVLFQNPCHFFVRHHLMPTHADTRKKSGEKMEVLAGDPQKTLLKTFFFQLCLLRFLTTTVFSKKSWRPHSWPEGSSSNNAIIENADAAHCQFNSIDLSAIRKGEREEEKRWQGVEDEKARGLCKEKGKQALLLISFTPKQQHQQQPQLISPLPSLSLLADKKILARHC